ncbi:unnamed protein product [Urochloa humidicola]
MDGQLLSAAVTGDAGLMNQLASHDRSVMLGTTPQASFLLRCCRDKQLSWTILKQDNRGCNALHHAIRSGRRDLAVELIQAEPDLSKAVNQYEESPMFIAVMRNYEDVFEKLLGVPESAHGGAWGFNALHAAVRNGNSAIAKKIMETRPGLAREEEKTKNTPIQLAVLLDKIHVLDVLLEHDRSLGYVISSNAGNPLLVDAAYRGHVAVARQLLKHCPDAPYYSADGSTCLHAAVWHDHMEFVEFLLGSTQLFKLVNMRNSAGVTALHLAVRKCNPKMVAALLHHQDIDVTVLDNIGASAIWKLNDATNHAKTLNWVRMFAQFVRQIMPRLITSSRTPVFWTVLCILASSVHATPTQY